MVHEDDPGELAALRAERDLLVRIDRLAGLASESTDEWIRERIDRALAGVELIVASIETELRARRTPDTA